MNITGIGTDIEDISRFRNLPFTKNKALYNKIFTKKEIKYCLTKQDPYPHFTARFCAKEAFIKATNKNISEYTSIEVLKKGNKPSINWKNKNVFLSLSHEKDKTLAFVIVLNKGV